MQPLIDCDILLYELGFSSQSYETELVDGVMQKVVVPRSWEWTENHAREKITSICEDVEATKPPILFLTNSGYINKLLNKKRKYADEPLVQFVPNFREKLAVTRGYKEGRKEEKPFHFKNLINFFINNYNCHVNESGLEADDAICIRQMEMLSKGEPSIICSRDKDLRQCSGWSYSWECGKQNSVGPILINGLGKLWNKNEGKFHPTTNKPLPLKVMGTGNLFFYYQMLTGDTTDNIVGVLGRGPSFAYKLLKDVTSERQAYELTAEVYVKQFGDEWETKWDEMAALLYMVRELNEDGSPKRWEKPPIDMSEWM